MARQNGSSANAPEFPHPRRSLFNGKSRSRNRTATEPKPNPLEHTNRAQRPLLPALPVQYLCGPTLSLNSLFDEQHNPTLEECCEPDLSRHNPNEGGVRMKHLAFFGTFMGLATLSPLPAIAHNLTAATATTDCSGFCLTVSADSLTPGEQDNIQMHLYTHVGAVAQNQFIRIVLSSKRNASMPLANKRVWASWACT